jgi:hypothetical protein
MNKELRCIVVSQPARIARRLCESADMTCTKNCANIPKNQTNLVRQVRYETNCVAKQYFLPAIARGDNQFLSPLLSATTQVSKAMMYIQKYQ